MTAIADASRNVDVVTSAAGSAAVSAASAVTRTEGHESRGEAEAAQASPAGEGARTAAVQALEERNRALKLIDSGQPTMATVDEVSDTGLRINGRPVAEVRLLVDRPGRSPYPVTRRAVVPEGCQVVGKPARNRGGRRIRRIPVLVDPGHPDNVLLRWDLRVAS